MFICPKKIAMFVLFMILASPVAFQTVRSVLGGWIASAEGLPNMGGLAVHALVFIVLSTMIWRSMSGEGFFSKKTRARRQARIDAKREARQAQRAADRQLKREYNQAQRAAKQAVKFPPK